MTVRDLTWLVQMKNLNWLIWWKTSQPKREMGEENQTIDLMKNLPTQTGDEGGKPNDFRRESEWSEEAQGSIPRCGEDASMQWRRLHLLPRKRCEQCNEKNSIVHKKRCKQCSKAWLYCCCGGGKSNAMRRASSHIVEGMRAMQAKQWEGELYPMS